MGASACMHGSPDPDRCMLVPAWAAAGTELMGIPGCIHWGHC